MFSQTALLQFVFADELDDYFWGYVFRTELKKLLFFELHDKYEAVYYVDAENDEPRVSRYGRSDSDDFKLKKGFFKGSAPQQLSKWLTDLLKRKKAAVVFRLESFCDIFDSDEKSLNDLVRFSQGSKSNGSVILVCSNNSDKNIEYFSSARVFDCLGEFAICSLRRNETIDSIYSILRSNKQEACVFLNSYTRERLTDLVTMSVIEKKNHFTGEENLKTAVNYLTLYLNDPVIRMREHRIFKEGFPLICPPYKELYLQLRRDDVWRDLCRRAADYFRNNPDMADENVIDSAARRFHFTYDDDSIKTKCMKLCVPAAIHDIYEDKAIEELGELYDKLSKPCNRPINSMISDEMNSLLTKLDNAHNKSDAKTCSRIISSILFCASYLHTDSEELENVLDIIKWIDNYIELSGVLFGLKKSYNPTSVFAATQKQRIDFISLQLQSRDDIFEVNKANLIGSDLNEIMEKIIHSEENIDEANVIGNLSSGAADSEKSGSHWSEEISDDELIDQSSGS